MQKLQSDEMGFLVGKPINLTDLHDELVAINDELSAIKGILSKDKPISIHAKSIDRIINGLNSQPNSKGFHPDVQHIAEPKSQAGDKHTITSDINRNLKRLSQKVDGKTQTVHENKKRASSEVLEGLGKVRRDLVSIPQSRAANGRFTSATDSSDPQRDARGRFIGGGSLREETNKEGISNQLGKVGNNIVGALGNLVPTNDEADPSVQAMGEVSSILSPLGRGFGKVFNGSNGGVSRGQEKWYRRFFKQNVERSRLDDFANKREQSLLKNIERKKVSSSSNGGFIVPLLLAFLGALATLLLKGFKTLAMPIRLLGGIFQPLMKVLGALARAIGLIKIADRLGSPEQRKRKNSGQNGGTAVGGVKDGSKPDSRTSSTSAAKSGSRAKSVFKKIPLVGALLSAGFLAKDLSDIASNDESTEVKTKQTGSAIGSTVGSLGGMAGGAMAGAAIGSIVPFIGTTIGAVIGGVLGGLSGEKVGGIIGDKFGEWTNDLRRYDLPAKISKRWDYSAAFMQVLWSDFTGFAASNWQGVSEYAKSKWSVFTNVVTTAWMLASSYTRSVWDSIGRGFNGTVSYLSGVLQNIKNNFYAAASFIETVFSGVGSAFSGAGDFIKNAWSLVIDSLLGFIKDKTGIDLAATWENVKKSFTSLLDESKGVIGKVTSGLTKFGDYIQSVGARATQITGSTDGGINADGVPTLLARPGTSGGSQKSSVSSEQAMSYFQSKGWTKEQSAGIVANLQHESNFKVDAVGDNGKAYGIAQWHPDRQAEFKKVFGKDIRQATYAEQLAFVNYELTQGKEAGAGKILKTAKTASQAGGIVSKHYERPANTNEEINKRGATAHAIAHGYNGGAVLPSDQIATADNAIASGSNDVLGGLGSMGGGVLDGMSAIKEAIATMLSNSVSGKSVPKVNVRKTAAVPAVNIQSPSAIAEAPKINESFISLNQNSGQSEIEDVSRDISDRRIAHIVTGGYSSN